MSDEPHSRPKSTNDAHTRAESGGAGVPPAVFLPAGNSLKIRSRRLPHWEVEEAVYFVTFRLADSLPPQALKKITLQRADILATSAKMGRVLSPSERRKYERLLSAQIEKALDAGNGKCFLRNPDIAGIVANTLKAFDGSRYRLFAWTVMPNHVHAVFQIMGRNSLAEILHSWKSYSAKAANRVLGRRGAFWQREYHDHLIRGVDEFDRAVRYVAENPGKAGLGEWVWVWCWE